MNEQTVSPRSTEARESEIEMLARETGTPVETVQEIYRVERDKLGIRRALRPSYPFWLTDV